MRRKVVFVLLCLAVLYACSAPFHDALNKGDALPAGTVLLIGKFTIDPVLDQGNIGVQAVNGTHKGVIKMNFADNADQPLDKDALIPFSASEQMDWSYTKTSFIPVPPGTRYARLGTFMLDSRRYTYGVSTGGAPAPGGVDITYIMLYGDVRIVVPEKAKAVYIGTIEYRHDLKNTKPNKFGYPSKKVVVKDEYEKAMADLAAMKIPGISSRNVVKKLAVVVRDH
jgi:hypothetical protein